MSQSDQPTADGETTLLCDYCLRPIEPEEAVTEGKRDWHPECPKRKITEEEAGDLLREVLVQKTETKALITMAGGVHYDPEFAVYPAPNAGEPFVFYDILTDDGEAAIGLWPDEAETLGKSLIRAASAAREEDDG